MPQEEIDEEQLELAKKYLTDAELGFHSGEFALSLEKWDNAIRILFEIGEYWEIVERAAHYVTHASRESTFVDMITRLEDILQRFKDLDLPEEIARMNLLLAKLAFQRRVFKDAAENYESAAKNFLKADPEKYNDMADMLLIRAGECYEKFRAKTDYGEQLVLKAILNLTKVEHSLKALQKEAFAAIKGKKYNDAAEKLEGIAQAFNAAIQKVKALPAMNTMPILKKNIQARLLHLHCEYIEARMILFIALDRAEESRILALEIAELLKEAILLLKEVIKEEYDTEDLRRLSFDIFLASLVQKLHNLTDYNPIRLALENLTPDQQKVIEEQRYFKLSRHIEETGIKYVIEDLLNTYAGTLDPVKRPLLAIVLKFIEKKK